MHEADCSRVGSNWVPTKGDKLFSNKKIRVQKGSGRARLGDANSPHMFNRIKAHVITAPHDWSTALPRKVYSRAMASAFSEHYRAGNLFIVGADPEQQEGDNGVKGGDESIIIDFPTKDVMACDMFKKSHGLSGKGLLMITDSKRDNLVDAAKDRTRFVVKTKEEVDVRALMKANRVIIELPALQWFIGTYEALMK